MDDYMDTETMDTVQMCDSEEDARKAIGYFVNKLDQLEYPSSKLKSMLKDKILVVKFY
jgi:hypothetical protein